MALKNAILVRSIDQSIDIAKKQIINSENRPEFIPDGFPFVWGNGSYMASINGVVRDSQ